MAQGGFRVLMKNGSHISFCTDSVERVEFWENDNPYVTFDLNVDEIGISSARLSVTPSDPSVTYYFDVCTASEYERYGSNATPIVQNYLNYLFTNYNQYFSREEILEQTLSKGPDSDTVEGLPAGTEMCLYAVAVNAEGECYGTPAVIRFSTLQGGRPEDCTFDISFGGITSGGCTVYVKPSDPSIRYWMGLVAVDGYPGDFAMKADVEEQLAQYALQNHYDMATLVKAVTFAGNCQEDESGLANSSRYYCYVFAMDEEGHAAGPLFKEMFTTLDYDRSEASLELDFRYYDGDALYASDPATYANIQGRVALDVTAKPNPYAYNWVLALASGDLSNEEAYPEYETKNAMLQAGFFSCTEKTFIADWRTVTLLAFAVDAAGVDGDLQRIVINLNREGASPISERHTSAQTARMLRKRTSALNRQVQTPMRRTHNLK